MDWKLLIEGILAISVIGVGSFYVFMQIKLGNLSSDKTKDVINTVEEVMLVLKPSAIALAGDLVDVNDIYEILEETMQYARDLVDVDELDMLELIRFTYLLCEKVGIQLGVNEKAIIETAVTLIWMFAKK